MSNFYSNSKYSNEKPNYKINRLYSNKKEKICLMFHPLFITGKDPMWEDWNCYKYPMMIYMTDYQKLLIPYFEKIFPLKDPIDDTVQEYFDVCFDNWIGKSDWIKFINLIKADLDKKSESEKKFYFEVISWLETALTETDVIVVEGNL